MKFPGKLEAGLRSGVLTESKYVKGTYIVFQDYEDMYEISFKTSECEQAAKESVLTEGTKCFLVHNTNSNPEIVNKYPSNTEYRWTLNLNTHKYDWVKEAFDPKHYNELIEELQQELNTKQAILVSGGNIKTFYGESLLVEDPQITDLKVPVATTEVIGGLKSGKDIEEVPGGEYSTYQVSIDPNTEIGSVKIPPLASTTTAQELITILQQDSELTLNGGKANLSEERN